MESAADVLTNLPREPSTPRFAGQSFGLNDTELPLSSDPSIAECPDQARDEVLSLLSSDSTTVDDLVRRCHLPSSVTMAVLLELELAGRVETLPGNRVALLPGPV